LKNPTLEKMWKIIIMNDELKNGGDPEVVSIMIESMSVDVIDTKHAISNVDGFEYLLIQENGVIINSIESGVYTKEPSDAPIFKNLRS
jgi:hypothetical protein